MANNQGTEVVQVHLTTPYGPNAATFPPHGPMRNWVTWVEANLRPKTGMVLFIGKDPTPWTVTNAYTGAPTRMSDINSGWKVGGL